MSLKLADRVRERVQSLFSDMQDEASVRNLSTGEALREFFAEALAVVVQLLQVEGGTNEEKKAAALELLGKFYDGLAAATDIPYVPDDLADPLLKIPFMKMADILIDSFIAFLKTSTAESVLKSFREAK